MVADVSQCDLPWDNAVRKRYLYFLGPLDHVFTIIPSFSPARVVAVLVKLQYIVLMPFWWGKLVRIMCYIWGCGLCRRSVRIRGTALFFVQLVHEFVFFALSRWVIQPFFFFFFWIMKQIERTELGVLSIYRYDLISNFLILLFYAHIKSWGLQYTGWCNRLAQV